MKTRSQGAPSPAPAHDVAQPRKRAQRKHTIVPLAVLQSNYVDASTQTDLTGDDLTVPPAHTPAKRTRESAEVTDEPSAKRHQQTVFTSAQAGQQTPPKSTPSQNTTSSNMSGRSQAKLASKSPSKSPLSLLHSGSEHSKLLHYGPGMSYGKMTRIHQARMQRLRNTPSIFPSEEQEEHSATFAEDDSKQPEQSTQAAIEQAPSTPTPQSAPQPRRSGLLNSIRKPFAFFPQLPEAITSLLPNPFTPTRPTPPSESHQTPSTSSEEPASNMEVDKDNNEHHKTQEAQEVQQHQPITRGRGRGRGQGRTQTSYKQPASRHASQSDRVTMPNEAEPHVMTEAERNEYFRINEEKKSAEIRAQLVHESRYSLPTTKGDSINIDLTKDASPTPNITSTTNTSSELITATEQAEPTRKKRKRPTLTADGKIPRLPRGGFGLDGEFYDDDFDGLLPLDSNSDEETTAPVAKKQKLNDGLTYEAQTPRSVLKKRTDLGTGTISRSNKKVTFDDSPVDTPSKLRTRSHEYNGVTFADYASPTSEDETNLSNSPDTKANTAANTGSIEEGPSRALMHPCPSDFTPTPGRPRPGSFCVPETDQFDDSFDLTQTPDMSPLPATPRIAHAELPTNTDVPAAVNILPDLDAQMLAATPSDSSVLAETKAEALNKARSTAEKHKSNNPSRLSQVERVATPSPPLVTDENDEFAHGWPREQTYVEAGICSQKVFDYVKANWTKEDEEIGGLVYQQSLQEFKAAWRAAEEKGEELAVEWDDGTWSYPYWGPLTTNPEEAEDKEEL